MDNDLDGWIDTDDPQCASAAGTSERAATARCAGDCNGDGQVTVDEVVTAVSIARGDATLSRCPAADIAGGR